MPMEYYGVLVFDCWVQVNYTHRCVCHIKSSLNFCFQIICSLNEFVRVDFNMELFVKFSIDSILWLYAFIDVTISNLIILWKFNHFPGYFWCHNLAFSNKIVYWCIFKISSVSTALTPDDRVDTFRVAHISLVLRKMNIRKKNRKNEIGNN